MKNNMNTIASLLYLQGNTVTDKSAVNALKEAYNRVQSMMIIYDKLYKSANFMEISSKEYLTDLINTIRPAICISSRIQIVVDIDDILMDSLTLFPVGIIINELLANSFKYAFNNDEEGIISITMKNRDNNFTIVFKDNGVGIPQSIIEGKSSGFGINLVKILVQQLKGNMQIENNNGSCYIIGFVLSKSKNGR
jgi:two-component sensor histidine kinase